MTTGIETTDTAAVPPVAGERPETPVDASTLASGGRERWYALGGVVVLVGIALLLRTVDLGVRAMHHDESLHALFSYRFFEGDGYRHDPLMHGPLQFHILAATFKLADVLGITINEAVARLPAALEGTALVATPLLLRRWYGHAGVVVTALLLAVSPSLLYYSRFTRGDILVAVLTVLLVTSIWRYRQEGGMRWLVLLAAALSLTFSMKETAYLTAAVLLLYVNAALTAHLLDLRGISGRWQRLQAGVGIFAIAWLLAVFWPALEKRWGLGERPREADLMVVLATLLLPFLSAGVQIPLTAAGFEVTGELERVVGGLTVGSLIVVSGAIGLWWDSTRWPVLAGIVYAIAVTLFTSVFTNPYGVAGPFWTQLDYWLAQQGVERGEQPWYYYLFMLPLYELLVLVPALIGGAWLVWKGDGLAKLLAWLFIGTLVAQSYAGEKMPWLTVHLVLPLALLAGLAIGRALPLLWRRALDGQLAARQWPAVGLASALAVLLFALTLRNGFGVTYGHPDTPVEPLIYTQTSPDLPRLAREIDALAARRGGKAQLPVLVETTESLSWPWAWYLRDYKRASYAPDSTLRDGQQLPADGVVIALEQTLTAQPELASKYALVVPYKHRWWFPEQGYREASLAGVAKGIANGSLIEDWIEFYSNGVDRGEIGALEASVLFPEAPSGTRASGARVGG